MMTALAFTTAERRLFGVQGLCVEVVVVVTTGQAPSEIRDARISVRVKSDELRVLQDAARASALPLAAFMRWASVRVARREAEQPAEKARGAVR